MKRYWKTFLSFALLIQGVQSITSATIIPALNLLELAGDSSHIVVGKILTIRDVGKATISYQGQSLTAQRYIAELEVLRVLKAGKSDKVLRFQFFQPAVFIGYKDVYKNQFGLFFLKGDSNDILNVTNPYYPTIVATPEAPALSREIFDKVISEVVNVVYSKQSTSAEKNNAIAILERVKSPAVIEAFRSAAESSEANVRLRAIAALLKNDDISKLNVVERVLITNYATLGENSIIGIAVSLERIKDPHAIPSLTRISRSKLIHARRSAITALRNIGTIAVIEPLAQSLYDVDQQVRYQAVIGLAEITSQGEWGPSIDLFNKDERRYLSYWQNWG